MAISTKLKNINTVYLGKQVCVQIEEVKNTGTIPAQDTYVEVTLPDGVSFDVANLPIGTYDVVTNRWNLGTILPSQQYTGELCFLITDECLSSFKFEFKVGSSSTCDSCAVLGIQCIILQGQSCCEIDNCGFSKFGSETFDESCPDPLPTEPTSPPANPIDEQYHIEFYQNCEAWYQWDAENEVWNVVNGIVVGSGSVSTVTRIVNGNPIAEHNNNVGTSVFIDETITNFSELISGHKIGTYNREDGASQEIDETITAHGSIISGHKIADYTREDGVIEDLNETITGFDNLNVGRTIARFTKEDGTTQNIQESETDITNLNAGNLIGRYTNETGAPYDIDETITDIISNSDGTYVFNKEGGGTTNFGTQFAAGYVTDVSLGVSAEATVPFPFTFSSPPVVVVTPTDPPLLYYATVTSITTTEFVVQFNAGLGTVISFNWVASSGAETIVSPTPTISVTSSVTPTPTVTPTITPTVTPSPSTP